MVLKRPELKEKQLQARLKKSIKQSKEGKIKDRGSFVKVFPEYEQMDELETARIRKSY